jgi:glycosyltransferase involved in cell wall biosynthesis
MGTADRSPPLLGRARRAPLGAAFYLPPVPSSWWEFSVFNFDPAPRRSGCAARRVRSCPSRSARFSFQLSIFSFTTLPLLLVHFARYGPYHHARLKAAVDVLAPLGWEVVGLETAGNDATYAWDETNGGDSGPRVITAFPGRLHEEITSAECKRVLRPLLDELKPDAMAIAGWAAADALACLSWCRKHKVRRIVMSETREADGKRVWWKERIKRYLISRFDGALVGGKSHQDYLVKLGMPAERIAFGYNVVDNAYFAEKTARARRPRRAVTPPSGRDEIEELENRRWTQMDADQTGDGNQLSKVEGLKVGAAESEDSSFSIQDSKFKIQNPPYFLASNRFIERKNLGRLVEAYAVYANSKFKIQNSKSNLWPLCLLGDGELKAKLIAQCHELGLNAIESAPWEREENFECSILNDECDQPSVYFPGFRQIEELPKFYAHAGCFVHPALEEPWGLVLNEAMACGLPVLSGSNVGAAEELVDDGVNGWCFDAENVEAMAQAMTRMAGLSDVERLACGHASVRLLEERCPTAAFGLGLKELFVE